VNSLLKFGPYIVDLQAGEVRKNGHRLRLQENPVRVLTLLAEKQAELVTHEELRKHLWPEDTFADFENGLNAAVSKLRDALSDSTENLVTSKLFFAAATDHADVSTTARILYAAESGAGRGGVEETRQNFMNEVRYKRIEAWAPSSMVRAIGS
jgi:hypothetical protein